MLVARHSIDNGRARGPFLKLNTAENFVLARSFKAATNCILLTVLYCFRKKAVILLISFELGPFRSVPVSGPIYSPPLRMRGFRLTTTSSSNLLAHHGSTTSGAMRVPKLKRRILCLLFLGNANPVDCVCWNSTAASARANLSLGCLEVSCHASGLDSEEQQKEDLKHFSSLEDYSCIDGDCDSWRLDGGHARFPSTVWTAYLCKKDSSTLLQIDPSTMPKQQSKIRPFMPLVTTMILFCAAMLFIAVAMFGLVICMGLKQVFVDNSQQRQYDTIPDVIFCIKTTDDLSEDYEEELDAMLRQHSIGVFPSQTQSIASNWDVSGVYAARKV